MCLQIVETSVKLENINFAVFGNGSEPHTQFECIPGNSGTCLPGLCTVQPNLAWAPVKVCPRSPPTMGSIMAVPPPSHGIASLTEVVLPRKGTNVFIAPGANVMGDVRIGDNSSIWYNAVLRGEQSLEDGIRLTLSIREHVSLHCPD